MEIIVVKGDITESSADAIVLAANSRLSPSSGEAGAIFTKAGFKPLEDACKKIGYCSEGSAVITPGFNLDSKYIIHAVGPIYHGNKEDSLMLAKTYIDALNLAVDNNCLTIAFPALSTGIYNFPLDIAAECAISTIYEYKKLHDNDLAIVYFYTYDEESYEAFDKANNTYINGYKYKLHDLPKIQSDLELKSKLVASFKDTRDKYLKDETLIKSIENTKEKIKVYLEDFVSENRNIKGNTKNIIFEDLRSLEAAYKYAFDSKTLVLDFASGRYPGGGVINGAKSEEESICRSSTLYACLNDSAGALYDSFYGYHKLTGDLYSKRTIYAPEVIVFKDDKIVPNDLDFNKWYYVDIIVCAAPNQNNMKILDSNLFLIMKERIKQIFEAAIDNNIDTIILGAFGCGVYKNNPSVVSKAFKEVIDEYYMYFSNIIFAIPDKDSPNYKIFYRELLA